MGVKFKKGNPGGPGRPRKVPETIQLEVLPKHELTNKKLGEVINRYLFIPHKQLKQIIETDAPVLDVTIAMILYNAMSKGDAVRMEWVCQRMLGKVTEQVEIRLPQACIIERVGGGEVELGATIPSEDS